MEISQLLKQIKSYERVATPLYARMTDIYQGNISYYVLASIAEELKPESYAVASKRVAPVNIFQKIVQKLSRVYSEVPRRTVASPRDQALINGMIETSNIQNVMSNAEVMLNCNRQVAVEPYLDSTGTIQVRILSPSEFMLLGQDPQNPYRATTFVKFVADEYWIYTSETLIILDKDGAMLSQQENPYGELPFVYCSQDSFSLQPKPDIDSFNNAILIPKLLTDLNYAVQFQSHSIMYGIDLDPRNLSGGPDAFWSIKSEEGQDKKPSIGMLSPTVDVDKVLALITFTVSQWLDNKGIKPGNIGNLAGNNVASGISKIIDEADTSQVVQKNRLLLVDTEKRLWKLIGKIHNLFLAESSRGIADPLNVSITFPVQQVIVDPKDKREAVRFQLDNGLTTLTRALRELNPDLSADEIEQLKQEIAIDKQSKVAVPHDIGVIGNGEK